MTFLRNVFVAVFCVILSSPAWSALTPTVNVKVPEKTSGIVIKTTNLKNNQTKTTNSSGLAYFEGDCKGVWLNQVKVCAELKGYQKTCGTFKGCAVELRMQKEKAKPATPAADNSAKAPTKKDCGNVGQKECGGGGYFVCKADADCTVAKKTLPSNATAGHCWARSGKGYSVCTATKCKGGYDVSDGHCVEKKATSVPAETPVETPTPTAPVTDDKPVAPGEPPVATGPVVDDSQGGGAGGTEINETSGGDANNSGTDEAETDNSQGGGAGGTEINETSGGDANNSGTDEAETDNSQDDGTGGTEINETSGGDANNSGTDEAGTDNSQDDGTDDDTETATTPDNAEAIADAEKAYDAAHEKETSLANRMLGGATMAATGIGGMQLAQGLAEQSADKAAEADMQAYLATFTCRIGDKGGKSYKGGEVGIEVSGGNQLTSLYQQYVDLAADLKERKNALGMAPGIESTVIMDKANMGIYDEISGSGIENGTYASLYRASKGNDADKQKLSDQKDTSSTRVKAGAIAAGGGAIGGVIGDAIINSGDDDDETVTEEDCKKVKGTYKDGKCTCPGKDKVYKKGKCVDKSDSKSGLAELGASLGSSLGSSIDIGNVASMASGLMSGSGQ